MKKMLVITSYVQNFHNYRDEIYEEVGKIFGKDFDVIDETEDFGCLTYEKLSEYSMVFIYSPATWGVKAKDQFLVALTKYLICGGRILHCHIAGFPSSREGKQLFNGGFRMHPPYQKYTFVPSESGKEIFGDMDSFAFDDEAHLLYSERLLDRDVLLYAVLQDHRSYDTGVNPHQDIYAQSSGIKVPLSWKYKYGSGKMFYCCPGHSASSFKREELQKYLLNGTKWLME